MSARFHSIVSGQRRGLGAMLQRFGLRVFSFPYGWGVCLRNWLFERGWKKSHQASVPVVSIGNLTLGGTGKTPCVEYVARFYRSMDLQVAILSRGYGSEQGRNDEALVLEVNLPDVPHLQSADRVELARVAVEELESEVLVLDDGFQHRRLRRDLDVVLIDATQPWGHGYLFPRGLLREPVKSLRRAGAVLLTRCDLAGLDEVRRIEERVRAIAPQAPIAQSNHAPAAWVNAAGVEKPLEELLGRPWAGFCGLGNPEGFRRTLENLGGKPLAAWRVFPDHHRYTREDLDDLRAWARSLDPATFLAVTQKDLVKIGLEVLGERPLWALKIALQITQGREEFDARLRLVICH